MTHNAANYCDASFFNDAARPADSCNQPALFEYGTGFLPPETDAPTTTRLRQLAYCIPVHRQQPTLKAC